MKYLSILLTVLFCFSTLASNAGSVAATNSDILRNESKVKSVIGKTVMDNTLKSNTINDETGIDKNINEKSVINSNRDKVKEDNAEGITIVRRQDTKKIRDKSLTEKEIVSRTYRKINSQNTTNSFGFSIYDSWVSLDLDVDGDGYFSDLTVSFDADYSSGNATVYAKIYLSLNGGDWFHLYSTDDFNIYGEESNDFINVSLSLIDDIPTGEYDVLIDLFEVGHSDIVATAEPENDSDLYGLLLEDYQHENNTLISYVASELYTDFDHDGYYTQLTLEYDLDTFDAGISVHAEVDIINTITAERVIVSTDNFILGNQTEFIDIDFSSHYAPSLYDFEIRIIDNYSNEEISLAAKAFSSLNNLPIESEEYDQPEISVDVQISGGGGSLGWEYLLFVMLLIVAKKSLRS